MKTLLIDTHPEIAAEWHPTRNGDLDVSTIGTFSNKKVWWLHTDERGDLHEFHVITRNRTYAGTGCGACVRRDPTLWEGLFEFPTPEPGMSLVERDPATAALWHPTRNGDLTPGDVTLRSVRHVWWQCAQGHEWIRTVGGEVAAVLRGAPCASCSPRRDPRALSIAERSPEMAAQWDPTRNGDLTPDQVAGYSMEKFWWTADCGHHWKASPHARATYGTGCSKCRGAGAGDRFAAFKAGTATTLAEKFPDIAAEWHPTRNGDLTPADVTYGSARKVHWQCAAGHQWETSVNGRTGHNRGCWCCAYPSRVPAVEPLVPAARSLAARHRDLADQWHPSRNGLATPDTISARSDQSVWWQCAEGHVWAAKVSSRVASGSGCRVCSNTAERARRAA